MSDLLSKFPKKKPELPDKYKEIYKQEYTFNRSDIGFINKIKMNLEKWMHLQCCKLKADKILEIGCGNLNHLDYERNFQYYDVVEPNKFLYENSINKKKINSFYSNIFFIESHKVYDKILSIAVFEHIENLPEVIALIGLKLTPGGMLQTAIPSEGGLLWGISWRISTSLAFFYRHKMSYKVLMKHEHINNRDEIIELHKLFFNNVEIKSFPLNHKHLSLYTYIEATNPKLNFCRKILKNKLK